MGGYTNHGDPPACAAGLAVLELLERRDILSKVRDRGKQALDRLESLADLDVVRGARGEGLLCGVTLAEDIDRLADRALDQGVIVKVVGSKVILTPPLVIEEKGIDQGLKRLEAAMRST